MREPVPRAAGPRPPLAFLVPRLRLGTSCPAGCCLPTQPDARQGLASSALPRQSLGTRTNRPAHAGRSPIRYSRNVPAIRVNHECVPLAPLPRPPPFRGPRRPRSCRRTQGRPARVQAPPVPAHRPRRRRPRVRACGVPGDPLTFYAAASAGGVWKSTDGGVRWKPIFDDQPISSIGSIAVAPSDPNVIYVGSGEANIRGNVEAGNGIYKSVDAGKTWKHVWNQVGQIGTMIVHPTNPDIAYAAVLGHAFGPNEERGVYRTTDGGKTWQRVLFKDKDTGASDVCFDPSSPKVLFAGLWQARRRPWELTSGGPGSGLYTSRDGGDTWTQLVPPPKPESPDADKEPPARQEILQGLAGGHMGQGLRGRGPVGRPARLRPHRGGEGRPVPQQRRRRHVGAGQRQPRPAAAGLVLLDADRPPQERRHRLVPAGAAAQEHRRRQVPVARGGAAPRRPPRRLVRPEEPRPHHRQQRRRRGREHQRRPDVVRAAVADLPVLPCRRRRPHAVLRLRLHAGHRLGGGAEQQPERRRHRPVRLVRRRRRRGRLHGPRPDRPRTSSTPRSTAATSRATTTARARPRTSASTPTTRPATAPTTCAIASTGRPRC